MLKKVCGINDLETYFELENMEEVNLLGFIFYEKSPRNIKIDLPSQKKKKRVGVFVNESIEVIYEMKEKYKLDFIQLHGDEDSVFCSSVRKFSPLIKAFGVDENFDFKQLKSYENCVDSFLFDTKSINYGGTGKRFSWELLKNYHFDIPFLLSGGINEKLASMINKIDFPQFIGIDINSQFELVPGKKNTHKVEQFLNELR